MDIPFGNGLPYQWGGQGGVPGILWIYLHKIGLKTGSHKKTGQPITHFSFGSGATPYLGSAGINADTIAIVGNLEHAIGQSHKCTVKTHNRPFDPS